MFAIEVIPFDDRQETTSARILPGERNDPDKPVKSEHA
jgi:hypothetical protein